MHVCFYRSIIDHRDLIVEVLAKRRQVGGGAVLLDLGGIFASGDSAGDSGVVDDPAEGELAHGHAFGQEGSEFFDGIKANVIRDAAEGFAFVECFSVAVEGSVVVTFEFRLVGQFSG